MTKDVNKCHRLTQMLILMIFTVIPIESITTLLALIFAVFVARNRYRVLTELIRRASSEANDQFSRKQTKTDDVLRVVIWQRSA